MKVIAHTPRGTFHSIDEPIPPFDRAAVRAHMEKAVAVGGKMSLNTADGFIILPGPLVSQSIIVVENFTTPGEPVKPDELMGDK